VADGMLWVVSGEGTEGIVEYPHPDWPKSSQLEIMNVMISPVAFENMVYVCSERAVHSLEIQDINTIGQKWEFPEFISERVTSSPTVADGEVYIGFESEVFCLDAYTGAPIWNYTTGFNVTATVVADGKLYICSDDGKIYCLNADTGAWIWEFSTEANEEITTSYPAVADGKLYIGSSNGKVYCLGTTLEERIASLEAENPANWINLDSLPGTRINIYTKEEFQVSEFQISPDETTHIWQGWYAGPWSKWNESQRTEFLATAEVHFYVNDEEISLTPLVVYNEENDSMWSGYYRVFPPGYFELKRNNKLVAEWSRMRGGEWRSIHRTALLRVK
jgi:hypothetical protein